MAVVAAFGAQAYVPERHHVGVGPVAGGLERRPAGQAGELLVDVFPTVPQIVGNTPHLGVLAQEVDVARRHPAAGRERQVNRTAVFGFGFGDGAIIGGDFVGVERGLHVVDLEEVEAPGGEQVELRVIPGLRARVGLVQAVVVRIPLAHVVEVGHVLGGVVGAVYGQVLVHSDTRDAAHHVHAKLQAQFVDGGGERAESLAAGSTRETHRVRQLTAVFVENQRRVVVVTMCAGGRVVPVDVDDQRIPAGVFQVFSHEPRVGQQLVFGESRAVRIPAVPAHRRTPCLRKALRKIRHRILLSLIFV